MLFQVFYSISIYSYFILVKLVAPFNSKARKWLDGRKGLLEKICSELQHDSSPKAWFHCASLGEFEQARPVIEGFRKKYSDYKIILTFFSPSGYEIRRNYDQADYIYYLPLDTKKNAREFLKATNPSVVYFVKYEFWYHYISELKRREIPAISFSAIFRQGQIFFKPMGEKYKELLKSFSRIFIQDQYSYNLLKEHGFTNMEITGDTRFDRVVEIAQSKKEIPIASEFKGKNKCFIIGSAWPEDHKVFMPVLDTIPDLKIIIAPHEIKEAFIQEIEKKYSGCVRYSNAQHESLSQKRILIIDNIGMLSSLYAYGDMAAIGGAFGKGLHNTLEAAVFGLPLFFGPNYKKFKEARDLIKTGAAWSVNNSEEFNSKLQNLLTSDTYIKNASKGAAEYVQSNTGATEKILTFTESLLHA